jgi:hypothetical protein
MPSRALRPALAISLLVALSATACSGNRSAAAVCPDSAIIHGLDRMFGETANGDEVSVTLENIDGLCTYGGTELSMEMSVDLVVNAPPGTQVPYFVVIADPDGAILDKSTFTAVVPLDAPARPVRLREAFTQQISGVADGTSSAYAIYFGLDLPPDIAIEQRRIL